MNKSEIIPKQKKGFKVEHAKSVTAESKITAKELYHKTKERLLDVINWDKLSKAVPSYFNLCDSKGNLKDGTPIPGDHIRIGLPAPTSTEGKGFDWVRVEKLQCEESENENNIYITLRPSSNPYGKSNEVAHFYSKNASSTFVIEQMNNNVTASYYGRNEFPNLKDVHSFLNKLRNILVATGGHMGLSKIQWKSFIENIIDDDMKNNA